MFGVFAWKMKFNVTNHFSSVKNSEGRRHIAQNLK